MRCAVLCAAPCEYTPALRRRLEECELLLCADGGYEAACRLGLVPDLLIGDFDSYGGDLPQGIELRRLPVEKDVTDSFACLEEALRRGCSEILFAGAAGGRLDHTVANIQHLRYCKDRGVRAVITDGRDTAFLLRGEEIALEPVENTACSIFALEPCRGVTLQGLKYPLQDAALRPDFPLGVSNAFTKETARIAVREGTLLVVLSRLER